MSLSGPSVSVGFMPARPYFLAGDKIQGDLLLSSGTGAVVGCVRAQVTCTARAFVVHLHAFSGSRDISKNPSSHHYMTTTPFEVFDQRSTGGVAVPLSFTSPITFQFPVENEMPSTLTERKGFVSLHSAELPMSVTFELKLTVHGMSEEVLNEKTFALDIRTVFRYPNPEKPLKVDHRIAEPGLFSCLNYWTFYCVTDRTVYGPGDRMRLSYWYSAWSAASARIVSVDINLSLNTYSITNSKKYKYGMMHRGNLFTKSCNIPTFGGVSHVYLDVPMDVVPDFSLAEAPHLLVYQHDLRVLIKVDRGGRVGIFPYMVTVPVVFNSLSSHHLAQFPYPVLEKPLPKVTSEAQALYASHPNPPALSTPASNSAVAMGVPAPSTGGPYMVPGNGAAVPMAPMGVSAPQPVSGTGVHYMVPGNGAAVPMAPMGMPAPQPVSGTGVHYMVPGNGAAVPMAPMGMPAPQPVSGTGVHYMVPGNGAAVPMAPMGMYVPQPVSSTGVHYMVSGNVAMTPSPYYVSGGGPVQSYSVGYAQVPNATI